MSPNSDGCALFIRRSRLRLVSAETITFALSTANITVCPLLAPALGTLRPQNQVAIVAVCEVPGSGQRDRPPAHVLVSTTHLKATKNAVGELYRFQQAEQLLAALEKARLNVLRTEGSGAAVILAGDMNAKPVPGEGYPPLTYGALKSHPLGLASAYNDNRLAQTTDELRYDAQDSRFYESRRTAAETVDSRPIGLLQEGLYTTWKARAKRGGEVVSKHCIDYILYTPRPPADYRPAATRARLRAVRLLDVFNSEEVRLGLLFAR